MALKEEDKKVRRGSNILLRTLIISVFACTLPFSITGSLIGSSFGYTQAGGAIGVFLGISIFRLVWPKICRHALAFDRLGIKRKHFIWSSKHTIEFSWEFLVTASQNHDISYEVVDQHIFEWLDENNIKYQVVLGQLFFSTNEDLVHFKMVWG